MSAELHKAARCFCLFVEGAPASFIAMLHRPHPKVRNLWGISRAVTLPDYQGLGLVMALESVVCGAYRALGMTVHGYPAHPPHIRSLDRSPEWKLLKKPGTFSTPSWEKEGDPFSFGGRPCAVFEFVGKPMEDRVKAREFIADTSNIENHLSTLLADGTWRDFQTIGETLRKKGLLFSDTLLRDLLQRAVAAERFDHYAGKGRQRWRAHA
jgi:hypothetical protein